MEPVFKKINHIAIVVKNVEETVKNYSDRYGIGPWSIWEYGPGNVSEMQVNGIKTEYRFKVAICNIADTGIELIQPLDNNSAASIFLKNHGENLHHIGYEVNDYEKTLQFFLNKGLKELQKGNLFGKVLYSYIDSENILKHIVNFSKEEKGFFNPNPMKVYPETEKQDSIMKPVYKRIGQVAFVVKSVDEMVRRYSDEYGIGPWKIWEFGPESVYDMTVNGRKCDYRMRLALTKIGNHDFELIQPRDELSIYYYFMKAQGEGFHHLAYEVENYESVMKYMDRAGIKVSMSGVWYGRHTWVYLTTENDLKHIVELNYTEPGFIYPDPVEVYPAVK